MPSARNPRQRLVVSLLITVVVCCFSSHRHVCLDPFETLLGVPLNHGEARLSWLVVAHERYFLLQAAFQPFDLALSACVFMSGSTASCPRNRVQTRWLGGHTRFPSRMPTKQTRPHSQSMNCGSGFTSLIRGSIRHASSQLYIGKTSRHLASHQVTWSLTGGRLKRKMVFQDPL